MTGPAVMDGCYYCSPSHQSGDMSTVTSHLLLQTRHTSHLLLQTRAWLTLWLPDPCKSPLCSEEWGTGHHYIGARSGWRDQGVICNILLQNFSDISDKSISNTNRIRIKLLSNNNFSLVAINNLLTLRKYCA